MVTVEAARTPWRLLGELLVERGLITEQMLVEALTEQESTSDRLGEILLRLQFVTAEELAGALAEQLEALLAEQAEDGSSLSAEIQRRVNRSSNRSA
jgi:hypothetical protein